MQAILHVRQVRQPRLPAFASREAGRATRPSSLRIVCACQPLNRTGGCLVQWSLRHDANISPVN